MPNEQVWGQNAPNHTREADQDLVSLGNEIIEVADIEDDSRVALKASNTDGVDAVAIEAEGKVVVTANSDGNPVSIGLKTTNDSTNANARALKVEGKSEFDGNIFTTESSHSTLKINDVNEDNDAKVAIHTINSSQNSGSRALKVDTVISLI